MGGIPLDLLIFAAVAVFLVWKLAGVLGKRIGHEDQNPTDPGASNSVRRSRKEDSKDSVDSVLGTLTRKKNSESPSGKTVKSGPDKSNKGKPSKGKSGKSDKVIEAAFGRSDEVESEDLPDYMRDPKIAKALTQMGKMDSEFDADGFIAGSLYAFETIFQAFCDGDREGLQPLLTSDVFRNFAKVIDQREKKGLLCKDTLLAVEPPQITAAQVKGSVASITVAFETEQVHLIVDEEEKIIEGSPSQVNRITDLWTFNRDMRSADPNWFLSGTATAT